MAPPGPLSSHAQMSARTQGQFGQRTQAPNFNRGIMSTGRAYTPPGRNYGAPKSRFAIEPNGSGGSDIILDEDEQVTVGMNEDGQVTISVSDKEEPGALSNGGRNGRAFTGQRNKMSVQVADDGRLVVTADEGSTLHVVGDAASGAVALVELPDNLDLPEPVEPLTTEPVPTPLPST